MNTSSNAMPDSPAESRETAAMALSPTRPFVWCVRRELWENRSVYLAPLAVAGVLMFGFILSATAGIWESHLRIDATASPDKLADPYGFAAAFILGTAFIVSFFYSIDCLYGERRDRSILFWKSLPVSDLTTVFSKAVIPLVFLPMFSFAVTVVVQYFMLLYSTLVVAASGQSVAMLWSKLHLFQMSSGLLFHLVTVHMLWYMPIYGWLLLVSAWARRAPFLWAVLPLAGIGIFERFTFHTTYFATLVLHRFSGPESTHAAGHDSMSSMFSIDAATFFSAPGLWIGLVVAAIFLAAAVRLRRYREPI
jgi:ABC-2 type transport system permease protein